MMGVALLAALAGGSAGAGAGASSEGSEVPDWLGLAAGAPAAAETVLAADMAGLFGAAEPLRVLPLLGDAGAGNIALLLDAPHVDIAFVSTDALAAAVGARKDLAQHLELVARLYPQEVHVLARADIRSLADLGGKKVNFGPQGSSSAVTASALFKAVGVEVEPQSLEAGIAIERLKQGTISAAVVVGGKPSPLIAGIPADLGLHLLPVSFGASLEAAYLPTRLGAADYPNLIEVDSEVPTIATGIVLLAAKSKSDPGARVRIARFVDTLFARFAALQAPDRHPKWREVNLAATLPGFSRTPEADAWLARRMGMAAKPIVARGGADAAVPSPVTSPDENEVLFRKFIEWQQNSGN
jgi:TRAP transporter TAXI family solute receptor